MSAISLRHPDFALVLAELKSFSIAASLALFLTIGGYWLSSKGDKIKEDFVKITAQESGMHLLPDNSKVWMEPGSSINTPNHSHTTGKYGLKATLCLK